MRANGVSELEIFLHLLVQKEPFPGCSLAYDHFFFRRSTLLMSDDILCERTDLVSLKIFAFLSPKRAISRLLTGWWPFFFRRSTFADEWWHLCERTEWESLKIFAFFSLFYVLFYASYAFFKLSKLLGGQNDMFAPPSFRLGGRPPPLPPHFRRLWHWPLNLEVCSIQG